MKTWGVAVMFDGTMNFYAVNALNEDAATKIIQEVVEDYISIEVMPIEELLYAQYEGVAILGTV